MSIQNRAFSDTPIGNNAAQRKEEFKSIVAEKIKRPGIEKLMGWLETTDFYVSPASTRYHGAYEGGLCEHSLNVYMALVRYANYVAGQYGLQYSEETLAIVSLFHDLCKSDMYSVEMRNKKDANGSWIKEPYYTVDDQLPYGHGEKSVYVLSSFLKLSREEAFAIRYHMGAWQDGEKSNAGKAYNMFPLAYMVAQADQEATFLIENPALYDK